MHSGRDTVSGFGAAIFGCSGTELTASERSFFAEYQPFGFILFARNIESAAQLRKLCSDLRSTVTHDPPILIDQEGGRVQRLREPLAREWLPPLDHVALLGQHAERGMYLRNRIIAAELMSYGIDCNCAPMLDVAIEKTHPFLMNRCYGTDPKRVSLIGRAVADGLMDGGVLPIVKHIPGHGRATIDSHFDLPRTDANREVLENDFAPFTALNDISIGMTAHIVFEQIDEEPATTSKTMITLIREHIGFNGLLMCDDLSMEALSGTISERAQASLEAGCDVILHCNGHLEEMQSVGRQAGQMHDLAQSRAEAVLNSRRTPTEVDIDALSAELESLATG